jgi:hypothetical protein
MISRPVYETDGDGFPPRKKKLTYWLWRKKIFVIMLR